MEPFQETYVPGYQEYIRIERVPEGDAKARWQAGIIRGRIQEAIGFWETRIMPGKRYTTIRERFMTEVLGRNIADPNQNASLRVKMAEGSYCREHARTIFVNERANGRPTAKALLGAMLKLTSRCVNEHPCGPDEVSTYSRNFLGIEYGRPLEFSRRLTGLTLESIAFRALSLLPEKHIDTIFSRSQDILLNIGKGMKFIADTLSGIDNGTMDRMNFINKAQPGLPTVLATMIWPLINSDAVRKILQEQTNTENCQQLCSCLYQGYKNINYFVLPYVAGERMGGVWGYLLGEKGLAFNSEGTATLDLATVGAVALALAFLSMKSRSKNGTCLKTLLCDWTDSEVTTETPTGKIKITNPTGYGNPPTRKYLVPHCGTLFGDRPVYEKMPVVMATFKTIIISAVSGALVYLATQQAVCNR